MKISGTFGEKNPRSHLYVGPMKSGKSAHLIAHAQKYGVFCSVYVIKPKIDTTASKEEIASRIGTKVKCVALNELSECHEDPAFLTATVCVIDEAQFFPDLLQHVMLWSPKKNHIIAALDADSEQKKFGQVWDIIPYVHEVAKLCALCEMCKDGTEAIATIAKGEKTSQIQIDDREKTVYKSVCHYHIWNED